MGRVLEDDGTVSEGSLLGAHVEMVQDVLEDAHLQGGILEGHLEDVEEVGEQVGRQVGQFVLEGLEVLGEEVEVGQVLVLHHDALEHFQQNGQVEEEEEEEVVITVGMPHLLQTPLFDADLLQHLRDAVVDQVHSQVVVPLVQDLFR